MKIENEINSNGITQHSLNCKIVLHSISDNSIDEIAPLPERTVYGCKKKFVNTHIHIYKCVRASKRILITTLKLLPRCERILRIDFFIFNVFCILRLGAAKQLQVGAYIRIVDDLLINIEREICENTSCIYG